MISSRRFHTIFQYWRNIGMAVLATPPPAAEPPTGLISVIEFMGLPIGLSALNQRNAGADEQGARLADLLEHAASARPANHDHVARNNSRIAVGRSAEARIGKERA